MLWKRFWSFFIRCPSRVYFASLHRCVHGLSSLSLTSFSVRQHTHVCISFPRLRRLSHDVTPSRPITAFLLCLCRQYTALGILLIKSGLCGEKLQYRGEFWLTHLILTSAKCALTCQLSKQTGGLRLKPAILHDFSSIRDWMHVWTIHLGYGSGFRAPKRLCRAYRHHERWETHNNRSLETPTLWARVTLSEHLIQ